MLFYKNLRFSFVSFITNSLIVLSLVFVPLSANCSAAVRQMSEDDALKALRQLTKDGKLPPENVVLEIENRFAKTKTAALAKLLRARIRFENNDFDGAANILDSDVFRQKTKLADYALWLRGKALLQVGKHPEAMSVFAELVRDFPTSLRFREAKMMWANSASQAGQTDKIPNFLQDLNEKNQADALLLTARAFEAQGDQTSAISFYRKVYFYGAGTDASKEAETKLAALGQNLAPQTSEELLTRADKLYAAKNYADAQASYSTLLLNFPNSNTPGINLKRLIAAANLRKTADAQAAFNLIPDSADERAEAFSQLAVG